MMMMNPPASSGGGGTEASPTNPPSGSSPRTSALAHKPLSLRRRRSKGTIAGFASSGSSSEDAKSPTGADGSAGEAGGPGAGGDSATPDGASGNQPQHVSDSVSSSASAAKPPAKPCHSARMALLCIQNAIYMGARTQVALCPPGRPRRNLLGALQEQRKRKKSQPGGLAATRKPNLARISSTSSSISRSSGAPVDDNFNIERMLGEAGLAEYDRAAEECINNPEFLDRELNSDGEEVIEDPSSGDEDELDVDVDDEDGANAPPSAEADKDSTPYIHREPLYTPAGADPATATQQGAAGAMGSAASGKLPFNYRKLRWFDNVTASDRADARQYLRQEMSKLRKRDGLILTKHLQRVQRREKRLAQAEKSGGSAEVHSDDESEDMVLEQVAIAAGVTGLPENMTSSLSAALVLESLSFTPLESLEGMSKCYDAIVAAGTALLDAELDDPSAAQFGSDGKKRSKSEIMNALAPVLITTLEHPSGEAILSLAKLRRMCGTKRYQRRFVQRIAPSLIRPPNAAMWCLRHQNDMEAILAATEMILDAAFDIFSSGWHERGRLILADSVRAETLRTAADQLKRLSAPQSSDSLITGLTIAGARLHSRGNTLMMGTPTKEGVGGGSEPLAEWEVLAVDLEIRKSINNIFTRDWSRAIVSSAPPRDDGSVGSLRHRRGISSAKTKSTAPVDLANVESSTALVLAPPSALLQPPPSPAGASPMSPRGHHKAPLPLSPPSQPPTPSSSAQVIQPTQDALESVFGPSFVTQPSTGSDGRTPSAPGSPPSGARKPGYREDTTKTVISVPSGTLTPPHTPIPQQQVGTPPRSPPRESEVMKGATQGESVLATAPQLPTMSSSGETSTPVTPSRTLQAAVHSPAPLSPMSVGNASHSSMESASQRLTSGASVSSSVSGTAGGAHQSAQTAYLRTLTSTAAERKRTVAACRALRAQISRFEEAFIQLHGRPPKGAAERAPLATTYAQYREWKRAIRADAACRIQALFRGARVRWMLLRSNNPRMSRVVLTRAGRPEFGSSVGGGTPNASGTNAAGSGGAQNHVLNKISIPVEIGGNDSDDHVTPSLAQKSSGAHGPSGRLVPPGGAEVSDGEVEVVINPPSATPPTAPPSLSLNLSANPMPKRRPSREDSSSPSSSYSPGAPSSSRLPVSNLTFGGVHINDLPLPELQARKRELKQQLKQYDMNFARQHGRMPVKAEKEPIRHLYESYNALKSRITFIEREGGSPGGPPMPYRRSSSDRATLSNVSTASNTSDNSSGDDSPDGGPVIARSKRKDKSPASGAGSASGTSTPSGAPSQDLAALKAEKGQLHQMLRSYEKDFFKLHNRQVSSFADIRPVASQYRRYKEIKKAISALQQGGGEK